MILNLDAYKEIDLIKKICKKYDVGLYLVGGAVRDFILNKETSDLDLLIEDKIESIVNEFAHISSKKCIVLNKKIHIFRFVLDNYTIDMSQIKPYKLETELERRDFTINAIAVNLFTNEIIDPTNGSTDIERQLLKATHKGAFLDDPLRLIRLFRLSAQLKFDIEKNTIEYAKEYINLIHQVSTDRITQELEKFFIINHTFTYLLLMDRIGLLDVLFDDFSYQNGCMQSESHLYDVKTHSLSVYNFVEWSILRLARILGDDCFKNYYEYYKTHRKEIIISLKLAALFHDSGKPFVKQVSSNEISFKNHEVYSAQIFNKYAHKYKFQNKITHITNFLILNHIEPAKLFLSWKNNILSDSQLYDFFEKHDIRGVDLLIFALSDTLAKGKIRMINREIFIDFLKDMTCFYFRRYISFSKIPQILQASELIDMGVERSKLNQVLKLLRKETFLGKINTKNLSVDYVKHLIDSNTV